MISYLSSVLLRLPVPVIGSFPAIILRSLFFEIIDFSDYRPRMYIQHDVPSLLHFGERVEDSLERLRLEKLCKRNAK